MTILELEEYFKSIQLPSGPIQLNPSATIADVRHFLNSHFGPLKTDGETTVNLPLKHRLIELKELLENLQVAKIDNQTH